MPRYIEVDDPRSVPFSMNGIIVRVGGGYVANAILGGIEFNGNPKSSRGGALADLFLQLTNGGNPQAAMAAELAASGETVGDLRDQMREEARKHQAIEARPEPDVDEPAVETRCVYENPVTGQRCDLPFDHKGNHAYLTLTETSTPAADH